MRTIKFRGKCVPDSKYAGEWVEGGYAPLDEESTSKNKGEGLIVVFLGDNCSCSYHVITESVGQFTGLYDKNGKEIYEGDIISFVKGLKKTENGDWEDNVRIYEVKFEEAQFNISCLSKVTNSIEIIGNIYDNPELLKEGKINDNIIDNLVHKKDNNVERMKALLVDLLETIAQAIDGMDVGDYDCGELYIPHFRYEPSFEFTEDDVKTIKELAENECECGAEDLMDWFNNASKED